jgi:secondary thiamine-phosphate synthase enzyme
MQIISHRLQVTTRGKGLYEITGQIATWLESVGVRDALLTVFVQHTSASLIIQENADPDVVHDLNAFFNRLVPEDSRLYRHTLEGPDDMPAHIRAALTLTQLSIPVEHGRMALGTWQGVYLFEHRATPHRREVLLHLIGDESSSGGAAAPEEVHHQRNQRDDEQNVNQATGDVEGEKSHHPHDQQNNK